MSKPIYALTPIELRQIVEDVKITKFSLELDSKNIKITIKPMPKRFRKNTFLQVRPKMNISLLRSSTKRHYTLEINPAFYLNHPGENAIRSILMHELQHVVDYTHMSFFDLASFAFKYETNKTFRYRYERNTDLLALKRGAGVGLADFRIWLYKQLSPEDIKIKKEMYLTPDEIYQLISNN